MFFSPKQGLDRIKAFFEVPMTINLCQNVLHLFTGRAGHATILSRQCDRLVPEAIFGCRDVVVTKLNICRVPSSVCSYTVFLKLLYTMYAG